MKRFLSGVLLTFILGSYALAATTYTTHYNLAKPGDGSTTWGSLIRDNFDSIDTQLYVASSSTSAHVADTVGAHAATAISTTAGTLCSASLDVQTFLTCLDTNYGLVVSGGAVDKTSTQSISGLKTFTSLITGTSGLTLTGALNLTDKSDGVLHVVSNAVTSSAVALSSDVSGTLPLVNGGTGTAAASANAAFNALSPMTTLGDITYEDATPKATRLAGNTTATKKFLNQTGTGAISAVPAWSALVGADLPNPSSSSLGGTQSIAAVSHNFLTSISTSGVPAQAQPAFSDISGSIAAAQLPNPSASTLGGIQSTVGASNQWISSISTSGVPALTQPAFSNISGSVSAAQLPNPSASTLGGVQSYASVSNQWLKSISTSGVPTSTQPAFTDISGSVTNAQTTAVSTATASTIASRDTNANTTINNLIENYATTVTASGTTTLTVASAYQQYFTGSTTQTALLPVASTLVLGQQFLVVNLSSGTVTVQSSGANTIQAMGQNSTATFTCILTSGTGTASWSATYGAATAATVTSVAASVPAFLSISGSPITTSGTLAISYSGTALPIANGGTAATTAEGARTSFAPNSSVQVCTPNGHGSTGTKIRKYSGTATTVGTDITYASDATNGDTFTINTAGLYHISSTDYDGSVGTNIGISLNSAQQTTNIQTITAANRLQMAGAPANNQTQVSYTGKFAATDVIRNHDNGANTTTAATECFQIIRVW